MRYRGFVGDAGGSTVFLFTRNGVIQNLTGASSVDVNAVAPSGAEKTFSGVVTSGAGGLVTVTWDGADLDEASDTSVVPNDHWRLQMVAAIGEAAGIPSDPFDLEVLDPVGSPTPAVVTVAGTTAAAIMSAIERAMEQAEEDGRPRTVRLPRRDYTLEEPVLGAWANVTLDMDDCHFTASFAPDVADADDPLNCLFGAVATTSGTTTLNGTHPQNSESIVVDAVPTGATPGGWLYVSGNNTTLGVGPPGQSNADSDGTGVEMWTLVQASEDWDGVALTIPLVKPLYRHHCDGSTVSAITEPVTRFRVTGNATFDCSGGSIAVGVLIRGGWDSGVLGDPERLQFKGFSRAGVEISRCDEYEVDRIHGLGELNSLIIHDSTGDGLTRHVSTSPYAELREHANGYPRHAIVYRNRCVRSRGFDADINKMNAALMFSGGEAIIWDGLAFADLDPTEMLARGELSGEFHGDEGYCGVGVQGCFTPLEFVENAQGCELHNVRGGANIITPGGSIGASVIEIVNLYAFQGSNWSLVNRGAYSATQSSRGIRWCDSTGRVSVYSVRGINQPLCTRGAPGLFTMSDGFVYAVPGAGSGGTIALSLNHGLTVGSGFYRLRIQGFGLSTALVTFGADFADLPFQMRDVWIDGMGYQPIGHVMVGTNNSGIALSEGHVLQGQGSTAGTREFRRPSGTADGRVYAAALHPADSGTVYILAQDLTQSAYVRCASGAVVHGDLLRSGTDSFEAAVDNTWPGTYPPIARATNSKAGGAAGLVNTVAA